LREICRGERRGKRQGRAQLGADGGYCADASPCLGTIDGRCFFQESTPAKAGAYG
jgi:hypothetical protein